MANRKIIKIDEDKCTGCGQCVTACPEGALQIVDGKAKVVKENFCDGLGACIGDCPEDALTIEEREAEEYDEEGVIAHLKETAPGQVEKHIRHLKEHAHELPAHHSHKGISACPLASTLSWKGESSGEGQEPRGTIQSELRQWPVQLHLVSPQAPYLQGADLIIAADCVPFAYADFHRDFLKDKAIVIGCPKLDDAEYYKEKLTDIFRQADIKSVNVVNMEVPCCFGLWKITQDAIRDSGKDIPVKQTVIGIKGDRKEG